MVRTRGPPPLDALSGPSSVSTHLPVQSQNLQDRQSQVLLERDFKTLHSELPHDLLLRDAQPLLPRELLPLCLARLQPHLSPPLRRSLLILYRWFF